MSEELNEQAPEVEELASTIYLKCGVTIRNDECYAIAKKLIELGWKKGERQCKTS